MERKPLLMSIGLAMFAMYIVYQYIDTKQSDLEALYGESTLSPMVVAARDILQFQTVKPTDLDLVMVPQALVPPGRIRAVTDVVDAVAAVAIQKGEQVLDNKIISKNVYSGLDTQIALGRRAISFGVNQKSAVGFHLEPGNRVDLAAFFEYRDSKAKTEELKVFLQDILVLAVGRTIQSEAPAGVDQRILSSVLPSEASKQEVAQLRDTLNFAKKDSDYATVTLEVTPEQAQTIYYVISVFPDSMALLLRNGNDRQLMRAGTTNLDEVMGPESYYIRHRQMPAAKAIAQPRGYDFVGGKSKAYYE